MTTHHGALVLFGSGETGKHGRLVQEQVLARHARPVAVTIVETPAGFQPNVDAVTGKLHDFYERNLQNLRPVVTVASARRKGSDFDPDDPAVVATLASADAIFCGPGSPTYAARQLADTRTLAAIRERWAVGSTLVLASAAAIAFGVHVMPVYEIFRAGEDLHWRAGLNVLSDIGLECVIIPHFNNTEGGADLDTTCGFVGRDRFDHLRDILPAPLPILGIDEHTSVVIEPSTGEITVRGAGSATVIADGMEQAFPSGAVIPPRLLQAISQAGRR